MRHSHGFTIVEQLAVLVIVAVCFISGWTVLSSWSSNTRASLRAEHIATRTAHVAVQVLWHKQAEQQGCATVYPVPSRSELIESGLEDSLANPEPWSTSWFWAVDVFGEATAIIVDLDVKDASLAETIFATSKAQSRSGSVLSYHIRFDSPRDGGFGDMYRDEHACWYGVSK